MVENVPATLFEMRSLEMLNLDRNHLMEIPSNVSPDIVQLSITWGGGVVYPLRLHTRTCTHTNTQIGQCRTLHVLSLRENELLELPETIGQLDGLRVLDIAGNRLQCLPISMGTLKLDALWVDGGQVIIPSNDIYM